MLSHSHRMILTTLAAGALICACEPAPPERSTAAPANNVAKTLAQPSEAPCRLIMGWDPWEPYHYRDIGGEVRGLDIELVAAIAREAGCELRFDQEDWATLLKRLRLGEIDMLSGATRTVARESFAWFTEPYRSETFRLFLRQGEADEFADKTLEQLLVDGITIGTTLEYIYGDEVEALADDPRFKGQFQGVAIGEVNFDKLQNFEIDAFLEDDFVAASIIRKRGLDDEIDQDALVVSNGDVHLMLSQASVDQELVNRLNDALERIKASGTYKTIIDRYLSL